MSDKSDPIETVQERKRYMRYCESEKQKLQELKLVFAAYIFICWIYPVISCIYDVLTTKTPEPKPDITTNVPLGRLGEKFNCHIKLTGNTPESKNLLDYKQQVNKLKLN